MMPASTMGRYSTLKRKKKWVEKPVIHMGKMVPSGKMGTVSFSSLALGRGM